jgi:hypothetical protein
MSANSGGQATVEGDVEQSGVEVEPNDPILDIRKPFDPEKIKVRTESRVVEQILSRIRHGEIDLAPDFQRLPERRARAGCQGIRA